MQRADLWTCRMDDLADLRAVKINRESPRCRRIADFINAVQNPYLFKVGDVMVKIQCDPNGKSFADALAACLTEA